VEPVRLIGGMCRSVCGVFSARVCARVCNVSVDDVLVCDSVCGVDFVSGGNCDDECEASKGNLCVCVCVWGCLCE